MNAVPTPSASGATRSTLRVGVRLGARELRRSPWRALLVVVMVLLPAAAMASGITLLRTSEWTRADEQRARYGSADLEASLRQASSVSGYLPPPPPVTDEQLAALQRQLPSGSSVLRVRNVGDRLAAGDHRSYSLITDVDLAAPVQVGRYRILDGELASAPGEVALSVETADDLRVGVGDRIHSSRLGRDLVVSGLVEGIALRDDVGFVAGGLDGANAAETILIDLPGDLLTGAPVPQVDGWEVRAPLVSGTSNDVGVFWTYLAGGVGLLALSTIIAAAFAVGARRQLRTVGLLSATGAPPRAVTWCLVAQGTITGLVGSLLGVGISLAVTSALPDELLSSIADHRVHSPTIDLLGLLPVVLIGTAVASVAAWIPARTAAQVPTLQALAGRRPLAAVPRRLPALGVVSLGIGCALLATATAGARNSSSSGWALIGVAGGLGLLGGVLASAPWFVGLLERRGGRWPESLRLAGRSLARSRVRSSAVVAAVATIAATVIAGSTLVTSLDAGSAGHEVPYVRDHQLAIDASVVVPIPPEQRDPAASPADPWSVITTEAAPIPDDVQERIASIVPDATLVQIPQVQPIESDDRSGGAGATFVSERPTVEQNLEFSMGWGLGIGSPALLDLLRVPDELRAELADGKAISVREAPPGTTGVRVSVSDTGDIVREVEIPFGGGEITPGAAGVLPAILISPATASEIGVREQDGAIAVVDLGRTPTEAQRHRLELLAGDLGWEHQIDGSAIGTTLVNLNVPAEGPVLTPSQIKAIAMAAALLVVLLVVAIGLALAAKDSEEERQVLAAVGASPRILRRVDAARALVLALVAAVVAVPTGLLPSAAIVTAATPEYHDTRSLRPDLVAVAFVLVAMPAVAYLATAAAAAVRDRLRPARPDAYDLRD